MNEPLRLLAVFAHPDDETLGIGGTLAKYAAQGIDTYLVTATRGERGWMGPEDQNPGLAALGRIRESELEAATSALGICQVTFLDYIDGDLDQAPHGEVVAKIVREVRRVRPQVIVTFPPDGTYGHPDHIAISQFAAAATVAAADATYVDSDRQPPYRVVKLYYFVDTKDLISLYKRIVGDLSMAVDGIRRESVGWDDWAVTTRVDATCCWRLAYEAVLAHQSQLPSLGTFTVEPAEVQERMLGHGTFYRAFSLVNGGRQVETDLFEGIEGDRSQARCGQGGDS